MKYILLVCMVLPGCVTATYVAKEKATVKLFQNGVEVMVDGTARCKVHGPVEVKQ